MNYIQRDTTFITGGPVPNDSPVYVTREIENDVFTAIQQKKYVTIIGSRQVGKSSLLQRIQSIAELKYDYASALVDLSTFNYADINLATWAKEFFTRLVSQLKPFIKGEMDLQTPLEMSQFNSYFESLSSKIDRKTILILLDEASSVPDHIRDVFYSTIRWIYTDRTSLRPVIGLKAFNFVFAGVFEAEKLIKKRENSPFNVSKLFRLPDFTRDETASLLKILKEKYEKDISHEIIDYIYSWTAGHPYISQCLASLLDCKIQKKPDIKIDTQLIDPMIPLLENDASDNIEHVGKLVLSSEPFSEFIKRILDGENISFSRVNSTISQLELIGAIKEGFLRNCQIRNRIFESMFRRSFASSSGIQGTNSRTSKSNKKPPTVFVSSTYGDLKDYRKAVLEQIVRRDLFFRGMEHFGADPYLSPASLIVEEVRKADVYLGIFGVRYGFVHKETGLSMTELEFSEAEKCGKPMLLYIIKDDANVKVSDFESDPDSKVKLDALKLRIKRDRVVFMFSSIDDLKRQVYMDLGKLP